MMGTEGKKDGNSVAREHRENGEGRKIRQITKAGKKVIVPK
jgi:hypothetical protein